MTSHSLVILLPPSETKSAGGDGARLDTSALAFADELGCARKQLLDAVVELAADPVGTRKALGISERQQEQVEWNASLWTAATRPALGRYTGVLYDALGYPSLPPAARRRADDSLYVASALFGLLGARDPIPAYRLSASSALPGIGPLGGLWRPLLGPVLAALPELVLDLRSGGYAALAPVPSAVTVQVLTESGKIVSHWNKHYKGVLARAVLSSRAAVTDLKSLLRVLRKAGLVAQRSGDRRIDLTVPS